MIAARIVCLAALVLAAACVRPKEGQPCASDGTQPCAGGYACGNDGRCHAIGRRAPSGTGDAGADDTDAAPDDGGPSITSGESGGIGGVGAGSGGVGAGSGGVGASPGTGGAMGGTGGAVPGTGGTGGATGDQLGPCTLGNAAIDRCRLQ